MWIDADACPSAIKDIILRAAQRLAIPTVFVANKRIELPRSELLSFVQVAKGLDVADAYVAEHAQAGDLAVTQDIPLAAALVKKGVVVLDVRGEPFTPENIDERLSLRNFMQDLREGGVVTGGPKGFGPQDKQRFAASLDRELTVLVRRAGR